MELFNFADTFTCDVSESVVTHIKQQIKSLSPLEQDLLWLLSMSEDYVPWSVVSRAITTVDDSALNGALTNLLLSGYVMEIQRDWDTDFCIVHPILKQIAADMLSQPSMRQIHKRLSQAWRLDPVKAAYHVRRAGSQADVLDAVVLLYEAGRVHLSQRTFLTAVDYLEQAWLLVQRFQRQVSPELFENVAFSLGEALTYTDRSVEALQVLNGLYYTTPSSTSRIHLKRLLAWTASTRSLEDCMRHIEDGLNLWDGQSANEDVAWMLNEQVMNYHNLSNLPLAYQTLEQFRSYIRVFPSERYSLLLRIREAHTSTIDWQNNIWESLKDSDLLERAIRLSDPELVYDVYCHGGYHALHNGDYVTSIRYAADATALMRHHGMVIHEISVRLMGCCALLMAGRWRQAEEEAIAVKLLSTSYGSQIAVLCILDFLALLYTLQGRFDEAKACIEQVRRVAETAFLDDPSVPNQAQCSVSEVFLVLFGQLPTPQQAVSVIWANSHGLNTFLQFVEGIQHITVNSLETAETIIQRMRHVAPPNEYSYFTCTADFLSGLKAKSQGNRVQALDFLDKSIQGFLHMNLSFEAACAQLTYATTAQRTNAERARDTAQEALLSFERLGAVPLAELARNILKGERYATENADIYDLLTRRELEIAQLVSVGFSNKQISDQLSISTRTVSTHLDNVFKKLQVHSRTGLAAKFRL